MKSKYYIKALVKCVVHHKKYKENIEELDNLFATYEIGGLFGEQKKEWEYNFRKLLFYSDFNNDRMNFIRAFFTEKVELLKESCNKDDFSMPVVVVAVRNDIPHLMVLLEHYRGMGINNFAIIDNDSDDGTLEYLLSQEDVSVYSVKTQFKDYLKNGWKNQVIARMGLNHWYIYIDADEMLVYPDMEKVTFKEYIERLNKRNIKKLNGFVLDMYPQYDLMDTEKEVFDLKQEYCWYDKYDDKYTKYKGNYVWGGMRNRVFGTNSLLAIKRIVYYEKGRFICSSHYVFPFYESDAGKVNVAYLHYKFLPTDLANYRRVVDTGIYHNGSNGYKHIMRVFDSNNKINAFCELSKKWEGSHCLKDFPFMEDVSGSWYE